MNVGQLRKELEKLNDDVELLVCLEGGDNNPIHLGLQTRLDDLGDYVFLASPMLSPESFRAWLRKVQTFPSVCEFCHGAGSLGAGYDCDRCEGRGN